MAHQLAGTGFLARLMSRWWVQVLAVWGTTRIVTTTLFLLLAQTQDSTYWTGPRPDYWDYLNIWDAEWFENISRYGFGVDRGYPATLPLDDAGFVAQNGWAFLPGFPLLVRWLSFGAEWKFVAPTISLLAGFGFALVVYQIATRTLDARGARWSVALVGLLPPSLIFQTGYSDSLGLLFLALTLLLLLKQKYLWAIIPTAALSLTRPGTLAIALTALAILVWRGKRYYNGQQQFLLGERIQLITFGVVATILGFLWSAIAWLITGRPDAYLATELSWRLSYLSDRRFIPFQGWEVAPAYFWGRPFGPWIMLGIVFVAFSLLATKPVRRLPMELRLWVTCLYLYLLAVFFPQSSTFRVLLMVFPLAIALAGFVLQKPSVWRWIAVLALLILQWWWLWECWRYVAPEFSPP